MYFCYYAFRSFKIYYWNAYPRSIDWVLTGGCNSKCIFCEVPSTTKHDLTKENIFKHIDDAIRDMKIKEIYFTGGEIFLRKDIWDILTYTKQKRLRISLTSNGLLVPKFSEKQLDILNKTVSIFRISLDSTDNEQYDHIRGVRGAYENVLTAIDILRQLPYLRVIITAVVMKTNYTEIPKLCRLAKGHGVHVLEFQPLCPDTVFVGTKPLEEKKKMLFQTEDELIDLKVKIQEGIEISREMGVFTNLPLFYHYAPEYFRGFILGTADKEKYQDRLVSSFMCRQVKRSIAVDYDGSVKPCLLLPAGGHVNAISLKDQYDNFKKFRQNLVAGKFHKKCGHCFCNTGEGILLSILVAPIKNRKILVDVFKKGLV